MYWEYHNRRTPKAASGATRKTYGATWWGKQWLLALADIDYSNRLPRGKTYANKGLAHDLELAGNTISAKVTGSLPKPYQVKITVPKFDADTCDRLVRVVTANPLFLTKLLNRELPPELSEACRQEGVYIFPRRWDDLDGSCSCPDWAVPCKHMAAVLYLIANEIDKNPFVVFDLHGFDLVKALETHGYTESGSNSILFTELAALQCEIPDEEETVGFEESGFEALDFSMIPHSTDNLLRLLTDKPVFFPEGDFKKLLASAYKSTATGTSAVLPGITDMPSAHKHALQTTEKVVIALDSSDAGFLSGTLLNTKGDIVLDFDNLGALTAFLDKLTPAQIAVAAPALRAAHMANRLAAVLARNGAYVPQILQCATSDSALPAYIIRFVPALLTAEVQAVCAQASALIPQDILCYVTDPSILEPVPSDRFTALLSVFLGHFVRIHTEKYAREGELPRWFFSGLPAVFDRFENREYPQNIRLWLHRFFIAEKDFVPVFEVFDNEDCFEIGVSIEDKTTPFQPPTPLAVVLTDKKHAHLRLDALRDLSMVADFFAPLNDLITSRGQKRLQFDSQTFVDVFFNALPVIRLFGIRVLMSKALQKLLRPALSMTIRAGNKGKVEGAGLLSFAGMIDFQWQIALGEQVLSLNDFLQLVKKMRGIVRLADGYVFLEEKEIAALLHKLEHTPAPTGSQLLRIALTEEFEGAPVKLDASVRALLDELVRPDAVPLPAGLHAVLRPYQQRGFEWLYKNTRLGFGSLIADDMGLGKTLQVIAALQRLKEDGALADGQKALIVVPTTLLTNWSKEVARFAPGLRAHIYHGPGRTLTPLADADLLLTTYGVVRTELAALQQQNWIVAVIDEAQNIKNLETAQTKAIKKLKAPVHIAMTGTPVENRLSEYYSIFDFTNHGYLGSLKEFTDTYAKPIELERNHAALDRFRRVTAPFLLRRVKTDKSIIDDLPEKLETDQFCSLTPEQAALYQNIVDESMQAISAEKEGQIKRQGLVLKMLTALKQVCNHPAHFLKRGAADPALSGKTLQLLDLLAPILDNGEKALIFTQFREMGELLVPLIADHFGFEPAFLHGGVSRAARDGMVEAFQHRHSERILLLSLKAGGTGLNLTAASNVIHYDLWWNPAVEAQATDRAFRIGQRRNVQVHRFITQGTFEEKINQMLLDKKELANLTITAGEKWIGDLSNAALKELVQLE